MADILAIGAKKVGEDEKGLVEEETFQESAAPVSFSEQTEAPETYAETTVNSQALKTETNDIASSSSESETASDSITTYSGSETMTESRPN
jgi:hypothetical protein